MDRVPVQYRSEIFFEHIEVLFVISPKVHRAGIDRLPDLFGAGGLDGTVSFVKLEAGLFKRQLAMIK